MYRHKKYFHTHCDENFIQSKIAGNGGSWSYYDRYSLAHIEWIYSKNKLQIFIYNVILLWKFLKRQIFKILFI